MTTESLKTKAEKMALSFRHAIWQPCREDQSAATWFLIRLVRTAILSVKGFSRHRGSMRASALTFFSLLSLVPVAAMAFGIAKGFGFEKRLQQELLENFPAQQEVVQQVIGFAQNLLDNTKGGMIAGIGIVILFWAVIRVLSNIENSFNHIWSVRSRPFIRKLSDYLTIMLICPLLMILSSSITVFIKSQVSAISGRFELLQMLGPVIYTGLQLLPFTLIWLLFTLIYMIMPNTRVRLGSALLAGVIAGSAYQVIQAAYIHFQIFVAKYNAIYGSFAALPLFLIWLQISWFIVLIGAEISYAFQNSQYTAHIDDEQKLSIRQTRFLTLAICLQVVRRFSEGKPALSSKEIGEALSLSPSLVDNLSDLLIQGNILARTEGDGRSAPFAYQPARDIGGLTVSSVMTAIDKAGGKNWPLAKWSGNNTLSETMTTLESELDRSQANRLVKDL